MYTDFLYIEAADLITTLERGDRTMIVDVRDKDYGEGGIIKASKNVPSSQISIEKSKDLIAECQNESAGSIVFYCQHGQARSPKAAFIASMALAEMHPRPQVKIFCLVGGFEDFAAEYGHQKFVENL